MEERAYFADEVARREAEMERKYGVNWKCLCGDDVYGVFSGCYFGFFCDIYGFYKIFCFDVKFGYATEEEIKVAFRFVAFETYFDKVVGDVLVKKCVVEWF